jgi:hypothetical protein
LEADDGWGTAVGYASGVSCLNLNFSLYFASIIIFDLSISFPPTFADRSVHATLEPFFFGSAR